MSIVCFIWWFIDSFTNKFIEKLRLEMHAFNLGHQIGDLTEELKSIKLILKDIKADTSSIKKNVSDIESSIYIKSGLLYSVEH